MMLNSLTLHTDILMMYCPSTTLLQVYGYKKAIYSLEREIKETTETACSETFWDLHIEFDNSGHLSTKIYDKNDDFIFYIINFPYLGNNISSSPTYIWCFIDSLLTTLISLIAINI